MAHQDSHLRWIIALGRLMCADCAKDGNLYLKPAVGLPVRVPKAPIGEEVQRAGKR